MLLKGVGYGPVPFGFEGPNKAKVRVFTADAIWDGPVSAVIIISALRIMVINSGRVDLPTRSITDEEKGRKESKN